jgi:hypothetical protein
MYIENLFAYLLSSRTSGALLSHLSLVPELEDLKISLKLTGLERREVPLLVIGRAKGDVR